MIVEKKKQQQKNEKDRQNSANHIIQFSRMKRENAVLYLRSILIYFELDYNIN